MGRILRVSGAMMVFGLLLLWTWWRIGPFAAQAVLLAGSGWVLRNVPSVSSSTQNVAA